MARRTPVAEEPTTDRLSFERTFWAAHPEARLAGVDEAGRGCLAGPVVAGAVEIDPTDLEELARTDLAAANDSKQLTEKQREKLWQVITNHPKIRYGVGIGSVAEIDTLNILNATHVAMRRALEALPQLPNYAFVDGLPVKGLPIEHQAIVKGDARSLLVACASIVAKVTRDRQMVELDKLYPEYGFAGHKGYGSAAHMEALRQIGPCPIHRRTFIKGILGEN